MSRDWEYGIKRSFDGSDKVCQVKLPQGCIRLDKSEIEDVFEKSVMGSIIRLFEGQVEDIAGKTGSGFQFVVLLVGFGRCPYIYQSLEKASEDDVEVLQSQGNRPYVDALLTSLDIILTH